MTLSTQKQFPDFGFRLGILSAMLDEGTLQESDIEPALQKGVDAVRSHSKFWHEGVLDMDSFGPEEILSILVENFGDVLVSQSQLDSVTSLNFDGGNEIYMYLEGHSATLLDLEDWELDTGGESDLYLVNNFEGAQILQNLEELDLDAYGWCTTIRDASPLGKVPSLKKITSVEAKQLSNSEAISGLLQQ